MSIHEKSKGLRALVNEYLGDDPERAASFEKACDNLEIGVQLNRLRSEAGLSTRALARRVGTQASVISRIERADYEGHSLSMLRRVAAALGQRVEIRFLPIDEEPGKAKQSPATGTIQSGSTKTIEVTMK